MTDPKPRGVYTRRLYDESLHCGAPKDRSLEFLIAKREECLRKIADLQALGESQELNVQQKTVLKRKGQRAGFFAIEIEKIEKHGPDDRPCMNRKGVKTTHPGVGSCASHCECKGRENFHLSNKLNYGRKARNPRLRQIIDEMEAAGHDLLDIMPEMAMLKATIKLLCEEREDLLSPETVKSLAILQEQIRKTVETANAKKLASMLSIETYNLALLRMGEVVAEFVQDPEVLDKIIGKWDRITVETAPKRIQAALSAGKTNE